MNLKTVSSYSVEIYSKMITKTSQIRFKELQNFFYGKRSNEVCVLPVKCTEKVRHNFVK